VDIATVDELLTTTRSVRRRMDISRPVGLPVIRECLELAFQAPSRANTQEWAWIVVQDPEQRAALAAHYRAVSVPDFSRLVETAVDDHTRRLYEGALYLAEILADVPVHVLACVSVDLNSMTRDRLPSVFASIYPAVWSFQLALRSRGLGSTLTTVHLKRSQEVADVLGLPEGVTQAALIPVAYFTGESFRPRERNRQNDQVYLDRWGHPLGP
jgi:nitroreductase